MELSLDKGKTLDSDYWNMIVTINDEALLDKQGSKLTPFTEVFLIFKKYMEAKRCLILQNVIQGSVA